MRNTATVNPRQERAVQRLQILLAEAEQAAEQKESQQPATTEVWATAQAAGFIEALALIDPVLTDELVPEIRALMLLVNDLNRSTVSDSTLAGVGAQQRRNLADRRGVAHYPTFDRRHHSRRLLSDRCGSNGRPSG